MNPTPRKRTITGLLILSAVALYFTIRIAWPRTHHIDDLNRTALAFSSLSIIQKPAVVDHAGTAIGLIHTTEQGEGVFIENIATKTEQKICEVKDAQYDPPSAWLYGWSPDDKTFAFSWNQILHFVNGATGESISDTAIPMGIQSFAWMSPDTCAYIGKDWKLVLLKHSDEGWKENRSWSLPVANGTPEQLLASGTNSVAWRARRAVWQMDLSSGQPKPFFTVAGTGIRSMAYSIETGTFLIADLRGSTFRSLIAVSNSGGDPVVKVLPCNRPGINSVQWINKGTGYAYQNDTFGRNGTVTLVVKANSEAPEKLYFQHGQAFYIFCQGEDSKVYAVGNQTDEAFSVWRCDAGIDKVDCIWSPVTDTNIELHYQPLLTGHADMGNNRFENFYLIPPARFSNHKKYPLIIGFGDYEWCPASQGAATGQCVANCGAYAAYVPYRWPANQKRDEAVYWDTAATLRAVYDQLLTNPHIDASRVYIYGFSENTEMVKLLADRFPRRWKGVILLSSIGAFPPAKSGITTRLMAFSTSPGIEQNFRHNQEEMFKVGIPMEWHILDGSHVPRNQQLLFDETSQITEMIFSK